MGIILKYNIMYKKPSFRKTSITNSSIEVGQMIHDKVKAVIEQGESLQVLS